MAFSEKKLILASASPRRRDLLGRFGLPFEVIPARGEEEVDLALTPEETVKALSAAKAEEIASLTGDKDAIIIGSDTVVERGGVILGKPADRADAARMSFECALTLCNSPNMIKVASMEEPPQDRKGSVMPITGRMAKHIPRFKSTCTTSIAPTPAQINPP